MSIKRVLLLGRSLLKRVLVSLRTIRSPSLRCQLSVMKISTIQLTFWLTKSSRSTWWNARDVTLKGSGLRQRLRLMMSSNCTIIAVVSNAVYRQGDTKEMRTKVDVVDWCKYILIMLKTTTLYIIIIINLLRILDLSSSLVLWSAYKNCSKWTILWSIPGWRREASSPNQASTGSPLSIAE
jgi:hypothetical protein